uniref:Uncharacterized protein n=1 Tax=Pseudomonas syringae pv. actinidiae TaxID=103796 RepID=A0A2P0QF65_PSESF|nr:hypothetical protein [Pseudomonas syringae pv. actinidiae]ARO45023.1 hypothetical protein [Pseudomonas syringae pv. actinidiae]ARO45117.1 hypothetical protein [Pseudomonas syringae pv. actinidiae]
MLEKAGLNRARGGLAIDWTCAHAVGIEARQNQLRKPVASGPPAIKTR